MQQSRYDLDIEPNFFLRQSPFQPTGRQYRFQHLYWPLLAALSLPYINWVFDWCDRLGKTPVSATGVLAGAKGWSLFVLFKLAHFALMILLPYCVIRQVGLGLEPVLVGYVLGQMLASAIVVALILGTHWTDVTFYEPPVDGCLPHTWHQHAFYTACDWAADSKVITACLGGVNLHLTHHLFPPVSHRHYPALARAVSLIAEKNVISYRPLRWREVQAAQQRFLKRMGRCDAGLGI